MKQLGLNLCKCKSLHIRMQALKQVAMHEVMQVIMRLLN
jgi:hypothetical protein